MNELWKRHWTTLIGALFLLAALATLFKYSSDQGWITLQLKLGIGLLAGGIAVAIGVTFSKRHERGRIGEMMTGIGTAAWYMTGIYAGVYEAVWEPLTVFVAMAAMTVTVTAYAYRCNYRLLLGISLGGALLAPFALRPEADHVFPLFLYLLVVNAAYFAISVAKSWLEPRMGAFISTWVLYAVYYANFAHAEGGLQTMPMRYAVAAFSFYALAFFAAARREKCGYAGWNMVSSFANTVVFCLWAPTLLNNQAAMTALLLAIGMLYIAMGGIVGKFDAEYGKNALYWHLAFGGFMFLIGLSEVGGGSEYRPIIGVFVWTAIAALTLIAGIKRRSDALKLIASAIWLITGLYWFGATWGVPAVNPFGVYVPFVNGGAGAWMLLAAFGFYAAREVRFVGARQESVHAGIGHTFALLAHLIVGGLLTVQITAASDAYDWMPESTLVLSVSWAAYALLLFLWGAYTRGSLFRWFGSGVLAIVSAKTLLFDLGGEDTLYKIVVFFVLGIICFGITLINKHWKDREPKVQPVRSTQTPPMHSKEHGASIIQSSIQTSDGTDAADANEAGEASDGAKLETGDGSIHPTNKPSIQS